MEQDTGGTATFIVGGDLVPGQGFVINDGGDRIYLLPRDLWESAVAAAHRQHAREREQEEGRDGDA
jgi:hypothetical protein